MTAPMISVVMPVYNAEKYIAEAVDSILNQTYSDFEFIIIDDCSTDASYKILQSYVSKDNRIRLFKNDVNKKLPKTLNFGISQANGKYIARMDADDISLPERFAKQVEFMESHPEIGICGTWLVEFSKTEGKSVTPNITHEDIIVTMYFSNNCIAHPTVMMKANIFQKQNILYNENHMGIAEDYALWNECLNNNIRFHNLPIILLRYRIHDNQTTLSNFTKIQSHTQQIIISNLRKYFHPAISTNNLLIFANSKKTSKLKLSIYTNIRYIIVCLMLKKHNVKYNLFNPRYFNAMLKSDSIINSIEIRFKSLFLKIKKLSGGKNSS